MSEFQLAPVINFQLPVYGIKKSADAAYDIFSLNTNLKIQCKLMVICGMSVQLYLVKKSVRLKFRQILSGVAVDKRNASAPASAAPDSGERHPPSGSASCR